MWGGIIIKKKAFWYVNGLCITCVLIVCYIMGLYIRNIPYVFIKTLLGTLLIYAIYYSHIKPIIDRLDKYLQDKKDIDNKYGKLY